MVAAISNATTRSASNRNDQLANPFGGAPNRIAMSFASCSPSSSLVQVSRQFAVKGGLESFGHEPLADVLDRFRAAAKRLRDFGVRPSQPVRIGLKQNLGSSNLERRPTELLDDSREHPRSLSVNRTTYLFGMAQPSVVNASIPKTSGQRYPERAV